LIINRSLNDRLKFKTRDSDIISVIAWNFNFFSANTLHRRRTKGSACARRRTKGNLRSRIASCIVSSRLVSHHNCVTLTASNEIASWSSQANRISAQLRRTTCTSGRNKERRGQLREPHRRGGRGGYRFYFPGMDTNRWMERMELRPLSEANYWRAVSDFVRFLRAQTMCANESS